MTNKVLILGDSMAFQIACGIGVTTFAVNGGTCGPTNPTPPWPVINGATGGCTISPEGTGANKATYQRPYLVDYNNSAYDPVDPNKQMFTSCFDWPKKWAGYIEKYNPKVVMLLLSGWEIVDRWFPGCLWNSGCPQPASVDDNQSAKTHFFVALNQAMHILSKYGARVVLLAPPYVNPPVGQLVAGSGVPDGAVRIFYEPYGPDDGRVVTDAATSADPNTNTLLVSAAANFTSDDIGKPASGAGIQAGTEISNITSPTTAVLSLPMTATATGVTVTIGREPWKPDKVNGVEPLFHDSKDEITALHELEQTWQQSTTCSTAGCVPLNQFGSGASKRPIVHNEGFIDMHASVDPGDAFTEWICLTETPYAATHHPESAGTAGEWTCDQGGFPTQSRVEDGVHLSLNALMYMVENVLKPAINRAQANYS